MHGLALIYTVRDLPGVDRFRIEQVSIDETIVKLVTGPDFDRAAEQRIVRQRIVRDFKARLGEAVSIRVEHVGDIASEASGKYRYVVSHVKPFAQPREATDA